MRAIDTNILVRLLTQDDAPQAQRAEASIQNGAWVSLLALAEAVWVLKSSFALSRAGIGAGVQTLLAHEHLSIQDSDVVVRALAGYNSSKRVEFSDCLLLEIARKAGHMPMTTFDRDFAKIDGVDRI